MPNIPSHFDLPRFGHKNIEQWIDTFHKVIQRQWTMMTQAYNALLRVDTAANMPSVPFLDEIQFYEHDTGRSYIAVSGNWVLLNGWSGRTVTVSGSTYTMAPTDAIVLANAAGNSVTITVNNGSSYASRIRSVVKVDTSGNAVYIVPSSGLINGAVSSNTTVAYSGIVFTSDGTNLYTVSE